MTVSAPLRLIPVSNKADLDRFIALPNTIFKTDPAWVTPLRLERRQHLSAKHNPYFEHARWQAWVAFRGDQPVGRITAQIDDIYLERYGEATGFFGMLDAEDRAETFEALLNTAEQWLRDHGMTRIMGPFNLSINDEAGVLIEGFDTPPMFMMGHARPYYREQLERHGYGKAKDLLAYIVDADFPTPKIMQRLLAKSRQHIQLRKIDFKRFDEELDTLRDIFNDAWSDNWGFVPFTDAEFKVLGRNLRSTIPPDLIHIAEVDGEPAAFVVAVPNVNEMISDLNGRLLPFGWAKLLWRLKVRFPKTVRSPLMGVRRAFHDTPLGPGLAFLVIDAGVKGVLARGAKQIEMSWILEDNAGMRHICEAMGGHIYKRYRVYEKPLSSS